MHPAQVRALVDGFEKRTTVFLQSSKPGRPPAWASGLPTMLDAVQRLLDTPGLFIGKDVQLTRVRGPVTADNVDCTPAGGPAATLQIADAIKQGLCVRIRNADWFHAGAAASIAALDTGWGGEGGCELAVDVLAPKALPLCASVCAVDVLLLVLAGSCVVSTGPPTDDELAAGVPMSSRGHAPVTLLPAVGDLGEWCDRDPPPGYSEAYWSQTLAAGDAVFIPQGHAYTVAAGAAPAITASFHLPLPPDWAEALDAALSHGQVLAGGSDPGMQLARPHPRGTGGVSRAAAVLAAAVAALTAAWDAQRDRRLVGATVRRAVAPAVTALLHTAAGLAMRLASSAGLVIMRDLLPTAAAVMLRAVVESISDDEWRRTDDAESGYHNGVRHSFMSATCFPGSHAACDLLRCLDPGREGRFTAARYSPQSGESIAAHDDRAHVGVRGVTHSRRMAIIYYLVPPDWSDDEGGHLVDYGTRKPGPDDRGTRHLPAFNTCVCFSVPRWHAVEPVMGDRPRLSLFGWSLEPGESYALHSPGGAGKKRRR